MATSGSIDFSLSRDNIITRAGQLAGVVEEGGTANSNQLSDGADFLNMVVKNFNARNGMPLWAVEEIIVYPVISQKTFDLGSGGDRTSLSSELVATQLDGSLSASATAVTVDTTSGMTASDVIGIATTSSGMSWTTISSVDSSTTLTLTAGVSAACADNNRVYTYTNAWSQRPIRVINGYTRDEDDVDTPLIKVSRSDYLNLSDKTTTGAPNQFYYDPQLATGELSIWPIYSTSDTNNLIYLTVHRTLEDFDASANTPDFPQEWYLPITLQVAALFAIKYGADQATFARIQGLADKYDKETMDFDTEDGSIFLRPMTR